MITREIVAGVKSRLSESLERVEENGRLIIRDNEPQKKTAVFESVPESDADAERTELSFSSDKPVMMWGEPEVLSHHPEDADFSRLAEVGAVLKNHNASTIVGRPENVRLDVGDRKGRLSLAWGSTETAKTAKHEALVDRSLRGVSVGFQVNEYQYFREAGEYRGKQYPAGTWLATKWQALEASLTPIPADASVGVGRTVPVVGKGAAPDEPKREGRKVKKWWIRFLKKYVLRSGDAETEHDAGAVVEVDEEVGQRLVAEEVAVRMMDAASVPAPAEPPSPSEPTAEPPAKPQTAREAMQQVLREDRERRASVRAIGQRYGVEIPVALMEREDFGDAEAREYVLERKMEQQKEAPAHTRVEVTQDGRVSFREAAIEGLIVRASGALLEHEEAERGKPIPPFASPFAGRTLLQLAEESLRRANIQTFTNDPGEIFKKAMEGPPIDSFMLMSGRASEAITVGTSDFPFILANVANKAMLAGAGLAETTYEQWCKIGSIKDFKQASRLKLSEAGKLEQVVEFGEYKMTKFTEQRETLTLLTYGRVFNLSRQAIINDDLQAFTDIPMAMGRVAAILPNDLAVTALLSNPTMSDGTALFATGHNNISDDESAYNLDTIAKARAGIANLYRLVLEQTALQHSDLDSEQITLNQKAKIFLFTPLYWDNVMAALNSTAYGDGVDGVNPLKGLLTPVLEPSLQDTNITGNSTVAYYEFVSPNVSPVIEVAFLNGNRTPFMEEVVNTGSSADGRVWKVRQDCVAGAVDWRGAAKEVAVS